MGDLFADLETVQAYIDNILVLTKGSWEGHLASKLADKILLLVGNACHYTKPWLASFPFDQKHSAERCRHSCQ